MRGRDEVSTLTCSCMYDTEREMLAMLWRRMHRYAACTRVQLAVMQLLGVCAGGAMVLRTFCCRVGSSSLHGAC